MTEAPRAAVTRVAGSDWVETFHQEWTDLDLQATSWRADWVRDALREHQFQEEPPPGMYPEALTVCSCGTTPGTKPDDDYEWWINHLLSWVNR